MRVEYDSNNSGGSWWLKNEDWQALDAAGWYVLWGGLYFCNGGSGLFGRKKPENHVPCEDPKSCKGHRSSETAEDAEEWLGSLARGAYKEFETPGDAMREFEALTGQSVSDEGCNCCGPPHSFSWEGGWASGEECLGYLYESNPYAGLSKRQILEQLKGNG